MHSKAMEIANRAVNFSVNPSLDCAGFRQAVADHAHDIAADIEELIQSVRKEYREMGAKYDNELCQILAQAIGGYPRYADDQKNFPGAEGLDVCVGEHVAITLAREAAEIIKNCRCRHAKDGAA